MKIGFIGLGIMGRPMALNLVKAGFSLTVFNRTRSKTEPLAAAGAAVADSPAEVARASDVVITIVSDTPDVESVLFGSDGLFHGAGSGKVLIDMSTISPEATIDFAGRLAEKECVMLDAPVSGGEKGAIEATLSIMVGGKREVFERCLPLFNAMGKTIAYTGQSGNGQKTKLVNQIICATNIVSMVEGLRFARLAGLDIETTLKLVSSGAAASWMLSNLAPRVLAGDFAPGFMIKLQQKDLRLVRETIQKIGATLPGTELAYELFSEAVAEGLGEQGTQGLINLAGA
ncbi:MAG TPA: NAD(P)-dependent oxidoreductase [Blastocatellia bacterium]|nr:NAD(P)-dependent oxidoreductase [Blastocatellia bacterium]